MWNGQVLFCLLPFSNKIDANFKFKSKIVFSRCTIINVIFAILAKWTDKF